MRRVALAGGSSERPLACRPTTYHRLPDRSGPAALERPGPDTRRMILMQADRSRGPVVSPADWDAYIASAPSFVDAQTRMEQAVAAGVDFAALVALQAQR